MKFFKTVVCAAIIMLCGCAFAMGPYSVSLPEGDALITEDGVYVTEPGVYEDIVTIEPGLLYLGGEPGNYAILNRDGAEIAPVRVSMARYAGDVIIFRVNGMYGVTNTEGRVIVYPEWTQLTPNGKGGYLALRDTTFDNAEDEIHYIDPNGEVIPTGNYTVGTLSGISEDRLPYMLSDGSYGIMDGMGQPVTPPEWLYVGSFSGGTAIVSDENGMGLVDAGGQPVLECGYPFIQRSDSILAALTQDGVLEVYTANGSERLYTLAAEGASVSVAGGCVSLVREDTCDIYARDGRRIYGGSPNTSISEGLNRQIIVSDGEWGSECVWIMNPDGSAASGKYQRILPLAGNRYAFLTMNGATYYSDALEGFRRAWDYESVRYGMIDGAGNEILPAQYTEILAAEDDRFILYAEDGAYLSDESGSILKSWFLPE